MSAYLSEFADAAFLRLRLRRKRSGADVNEHPAGAITRRDKCRVSDIDSRAYMVSGHAVRNEKSSCCG
jgi:hypothetical protein